MISKDFCEIQETHRLLLLLLGAVMFLEQNGPKASLIIIKLTEMTHSRSMAGEKFLDT